MEATVRDAERATPLVVGPEDAIVVTKEPAPPTPGGIIEALHSMFPRHFLAWNPEYEVSGYAPGGTPAYDGRWEIWIELTGVTHPQATHEITSIDRYLPEHDCWARKLQTYKAEDGSYVPIDDRLLVGLELADTWSGQDPYKDMVQEPRQEREQAQVDKFDDAAKAAVSANRFAGAPHVPKTREFT